MNEFMSSSKKNIYESIKNAHVLANLIFLVNFILFSSLLACKRDVLLLLFLIVCFERKENIDVRCNVTMHCLRQLTLYFPRYVQYVVTSYCRREQWHCDVELAAILFALANRFLAYRTYPYTKEFMCSNLKKRKSAPF